jgi:hypothetical protein
VRLQHLTCAPSRACTRSRVDVIRRRSWRARAATAPRVGPAMGDLPHPRLRLVQGRNGTSVNDRGHRAYPARIDADLQAFSCHDSDPERPDSGPRLGRSADLARKMTGTPGIEQAAVLTSSLSTAACPGALPLLHSPQSVNTVDPAETVADGPVDHPRSLPLGGLLP